MKIVRITLVAILLLVAGLAQATEVGQSNFVGGKVCAQCHAEETRLWQGSHHDFAMQEVSPETVLGDFRDAEFTHFGVTTTFTRRDATYLVRTEGPDGELRNYQIKYVFGVEPLQQYLIEFPDGRIQALGIAWDSRARAEGGQRWFHLYPDEPIPGTDELHWTRASQNWNSMCAECHVTGLYKNYDAEANAFATTWSEINVSCEACHGPGSAHVNWARRKGEWEALNATKGLGIPLDERDDVTWKINEQTGNATRSRPRTTDYEIEMCARCHSRRSVISEEYVHGRPLMDTHLVSLLDEGLYHADGQINDEVYVYGSFLQSKMYAAGVSCSDCHEPHSLKLRASSDEVCFQCHLQSKYPSTKHHHHKSGSEGSSCIECHMPAKTYMVVDPRHDHSFRIPRPDLSVEMGVPNACNNCHRAQTSNWAANKVVTWYGKHPSGHQKFARALQAGRDGSGDAGVLLSAVATDPFAPAIARATALRDLGSYLTPELLKVLESGLGDPNSLVRRAAIQALDGTPPELRIKIVSPLLSDDIRAVRLEAASVLADVPAGEMPEDRRAAFERSTVDFLAAQNANAERPEVHLNLGNFYVRRGETAKAEYAYQTAIELQNGFIPAYVNLADLYRLQGKDSEGEKILRKAMTVEPDSADVHHSLGLLLVRQKRLDPALEHLGKAAQQQTSNARYSYVYAIALYSADRLDDAVEVLEAIVMQHPGNIELHSALVELRKKQGR